MFEVMFLIVLAFIWISFASIQDLRTREVSNWLNFSLIIFAIAFRFFWSLFSENNSWEFFYSGLIGFVIFLIIGNVFYYARVFAAGDAKLMIALGPILPWYSSFFENLNLFLLFLFLFLSLGAVYGLIWSIVLSIKNKEAFKKEFKRVYSKVKRIILINLVLCIFLGVLGFWNSIFIIASISLFVIPYAYIFAKAVDESSMIWNVNSKNLVEGDWLYKNLKLRNGKIISKNWDGLNKEEIKLIQKNFKSIQIRQGIPFVPVFWFSFLALVFFRNWLMGIF